MKKTNVNNRLIEEIGSFKELWKGGYYEGDPLDPLGSSGYGLLGFMSVLHVTFLVCIKPYVTEDSVVLEIGSGRGAWTKCLLNAKQIWCLDALSAEHNNFWEYVGHRDKVHYFQVEDFSCNVLPEDRFDYLFSFGTFCHISPSGLREYMTNLFPKIRQGAHCFVMISDYDKRNNCADNSDYFNYWRILPKKLRWISGLYGMFKPNRNSKIKLTRETWPDNTIEPGRWYHHGINETCVLLESLGYKVLDRDVQVNHRDPVIHFTK